MQSNSWNYVFLLTVLMIFKLSIVLDEGLHLMCFLCELPFCIKEHYWHYFTGRAIDCGLCCHIKPCCQKHIFFTHEGRLPITTVSFPIQLAIFLNCLQFSQQKDKPSLGCFCIRCSESVKQRLYHWPRSFRMTHFNLMHF